jgi:hypothetical protein
VVQAVLTMAALPLRRMGLRLRPTRSGEGLLCPRGRRGLALRSYRVPAAGAGWPARTPESFAWRRRGRLPILRGARLVHQVSMRSQRYIRAREPFAGDRCLRRWGIRHLCSAAGVFSHCPKESALVGNTTEVEWCRDELEYQKPPTLLLLREILIDNLIAHGLVREPAAGLVEEQAVFALCEICQSDIVSFRTHIHKIWSFFVVVTYDTAPTPDSRSDSPHPPAGAQP